MAWSQLDKETLEYYYIPCFCRIFYLAFSFNSSSLLNEFGISQTVLSGLVTEEEKQSYIVSMMKQKLDDEYKKWRKELEKKEKDIQKSDRADEEKKRSVERDETDGFKWLKLKTKYLFIIIFSTFMIISICFRFPFLKKKLKLGLMEMLNNVFH